MDNILTIADEEFAQKTADDINKDYPGAATVEDKQCVLTEDYLKYCENYVQANCKIKLQIGSMQGKN